jgi:hypothetical protein
MISPRRRAKALVSRLVQPAPAAARTVIFQTSTQPFYHLISPLGPTPFRPRPQPILAPKYAQVGGLPPPPSPRPAAHHPPRRQAERPNANPPRNPIAAPAAPSWRRSTRPDNRGRASLPEDYVPSIVPQPSANGIGIAIPFPQGDRRAMRCRTVASASGPTAPSAADSIRASRL